MKYKLIELIGEVVEKKKIDTTKPDFVSNNIDAKYGYNTCKAKTESVMVEVDIDGMIRIMDNLMEEGKGINEYAVAIASSMPDIIKVVKDD